MGANKEKVVGFETERRFKRVLIPKPKKWYHKLFGIPTSLQEVYVEVPEDSSEYTDAQFAEVLIYGSHPWRIKS